VTSDFPERQPDGMPQQDASVDWQWTVPCRDATSSAAELAVDINDEYRVVVRLPSGEFAVLGWQAAETLRAHLAAAVSAILRGERR
jgi:hypothetical protein